MKPGRTEAFSDGVFAIAATLLVLEIHVPVANGNLLSALIRAWPAYASYGVSFLTIGIIWMNHHAIFNHLRHIDRPLGVLNLLLLLLVALIPFPTALLATYLQTGHDEAVAGAVYGVIMTIMGVVFWLDVGLYLAERSAQDHRDRRRHKTEVAPAVYRWSAAVRCRDSARVAEREDEPRAVCGADNLLPPVADSDRRQQPTGVTTLFARHPFRRECYCT